MPYFQHDGIAFHYRDAGEGIPFVFQHGLGGDAQQTFGLFTPPPGYRLITLECRGHGETRPLGDPEKISLAVFVDDLCALLGHLALPQVVIGGISMGAAIALMFTLRYPERVLGLVLSRPAWLDRPMPPNSALYPVIAQLIRRWGAARGLEHFMQSAEYLEMARTAPDAARSLCKQFMHPRAEETVVKLERIPRDAPSRDRREWTTIAAPTLVLANRLDPIHPYAYGEIIAQMIPGAQFRELTSKSVDPVRHTQETQEFIQSFLLQHVPPESALGSKD
ncbi:MAG: alpha/beta hydrolase [Caldilinea sp.]|nr:alpha/beta hydrolase [Caldilinea sp.]MDW8440471.1 alpha/beta hydrolase [Caldilineaceae bacterium]